MVKRDGGSRHVLIIPSEHCATVHYPLGAIFQLQQAAALHRAGYTVALVAGGVVTPRFLFRRYPYPAVECDRGFPVYRHYVRRFMPQRWQAAARTIPFYQELGLRLYREYTQRHGRPDVIHAHNFRYASFIADAIRDADGVQFVITEHSSEWFVPGVSGPLVELTRGVIARAAATTAVSRALADTIERTLSIEGIGVLPNIVEPDFFTAPLAERRSAPSAPVFLSIGNLDANKNHASLIEAFAAHFAGTGAVLRIAGTGPLLRSHQQLAARLKVQRQVVFLGILSRQTVVAEMQAANCLVLPSRFETFGVVLTEAMATGLPVIATRSKGPEELVNETNGILVDRDDTAALGEAMLRMAGSATAYPAARLREETYARFGDEAFVRRAAALYAKVS